MPALCTIVSLQEWLQRVCKSAKTIRPLGSSLLSGEEYLLLNLDHLPCRIAETLFIIKLSVGPHMLCHRTFFEVGLLHEIVSYTY